ncbi:hypothetical protein [Extibacter muris]|uniref:Uncharacterized protein n=1 Tax=Extibacter muris TaxID=1796622 RepID=A0A4R4FFU1_9FIRM|nr:hypothetical protein [Extibacter muris]MCU0080209.1 hypothetical protein [Extibacter muris]TDA22562.1 hypothetical protein E1963_03830 [Extibacter muris]
MLRKLISALLLLVIVMTCLTGCGTDLIRGIIKEYEDNKDGIISEFRELKDGTLNEFNDWIDSITQYTLTEDKKLKGEREPGMDDYVGSYEAEYIRFNGEEYIFGGTLPDRKNGSALKVTYSLNIESGKAALYWLESADGHILLGDKEQHMIAEVTAEDVYRFTFDAGYNFIVLKGDDFTGSLSLVVE